MQLGRDVVMEEEGGQGGFVSDTSFPQYMIIINIIRSILLVLFLFYSLFSILLAYDVIYVLV